VDPVEVDPDPTALAEGWREMRWTLPRELGDRLLEEPAPFAWWLLGLVEVVER
jgi:hypothetical protein